MQRTLEFVLLFVLAAAGQTTLAFAPQQTSAFGVSERTSSSSNVVLSASSSTKTASKKREGSMVDELGIPCEDECLIQSYPNLPESVHPGVLSGQAMMDLLQDAKKKGKNDDR